MFALTQKKCTETEIDFRKKNYQKPEVFMETPFPNTLFRPFVLFCDKIQSRKYEKCSLATGSEVNKVWCLYCQLRTDFAYFPGVSIVDFKRVSTGQETARHKQLQKKLFPAVIQNHCLENYGKGATLVKAYHWQSPFLIKQHAESLQLRLRKKSMLDVFQEVFWKFLN